MGCDITVYIELFDKKPSKYWSNYAECFCKDIFFGRDYDLFSLISDVKRGHCLPLYRPTGFKNISPKLSTEVDSAFYIKIVPDEQYEYVNKVNAHGKLRCITKSQAKDMVENQSLIMVDDDRGIQSGIFGETVLNTDQLIEIRKEHLLNCLKFDVRRSLIDFIEEKNSVELMNYNFGDDENQFLFSTIKLMQSLELSSNYSARFVCWFDN